MVRAASGRRRAVAIALTHAHAHAVAVTDAFAYAAGAVADAISDAYAAGGCVVHGECLDLLGLG